MLNSETFSPRKSVPERNGFLLLDKPAGRSSFQTLSPLKRIYGKNKLGFAGTLDPAATGLMVVGVGKATRFLQYFETQHKCYRFNIVAGIVTDTYDLEGAVLQKLDVSTWPKAVSKNDVLDAIKKFTGPIEQTPPVYSAIKIQGKRACDRVRAGEEVVLKSRPVHVYRFDLVAYTSTNWEVEVVCSKGTYVRSLAHEIGQLLECGAVADQIRRLSVGEMHVSNAIAPDDVCIDTPLLPMHVALADLPKIILQKPFDAFYLQGREVVLPSVVEVELTSNHQGDVSVFNSDNVFLGIAQIAEGNRLKPTKVFAATH